MFPSFILGKVFFSTEVCDCKGLRYFAEPLKDQPVTKMFCFIVMPMSQLGLLEALSLSSILCQLLLGLLAAFLPDLIGFKGSLRELTCSHDANMRHWETVLDSFLSS